MQTSDIWHADDKPISTMNSSGNLITPTHKKSKIDSLSQQVCTAFLKVRIDLW